MNDDERITIVRKKQYGCCKTIFCLRCINWLKADDVSILTSANRKEVSYKLMIKYQNAVQLNQEEIHCLDILILLYTMDQKSMVYPYLYQCRLSPRIDEIQRNDLEFYIPQLLNYLVFHEEMLNVKPKKNYKLQENISQFILTSCIQDFYFAHTVHWTLYSISAIILNNQTTEFQKVKNYLQGLVSRMVQNHENEDDPKVEDKKVQEIITTYGTPQFEMQYLKILILPEQIHLKRYRSIKYIADEEIFEYLSCITFWNDLMEISEGLKFADPKIISLRADLSKINEQLPSKVYVPFVRDNIRAHRILNIVVPETRIFSTKERAPFYICLEVYNPEKEEIKIEAEPEPNRRQRMSSVDFNKNFMMSDIQQGQQGSIVNADGNSNNGQGHSLGMSECYEVELSSKEVKEYQLQQRLSQQFDLAKLDKEIFGEDSKDMNERIRQQSPFGHFKSWQLVHVIIKTGDNLKQEQFALQLINQFQQIFIQEELPLRLTFYETQSLGPSSGLMQMVKDATTIDSLKKKLNSYSKLINLPAFFNLYFADKLLHAQQNFCCSLAAYCLVCYFLQIKDRHNGNILLHKSGKIIHIDFGFFLSIAPGKGLEFEKNCPFKLLSEYIDILGGTDSPLFNQFRKLFFKGFQACQKNQDKILLLVKMMYSGHGYTLPCFFKGEQAIHDLERRFNPPCSNDGELSVFTQNLINQSLDNWRARWYDKFQYYFQGIVY